ncbi:MAG: hypothetical protein ACXABY_32900 [Candidatus Thorarchaeota archaeon]|jgi:hypothetical protein
MTETRVLSSKRLYQRIGPLFVCAVFVGVFIGQTIIDWAPMDYLYTVFQDTQGMVQMMVQLFAAFVLYYGKVRSLANYKNIERTLLIRNITILAFAAFLSWFFWSTGGHESVQASAVVPIIQGSAQRGLFFARYGMLYYWVLRRFSEFRTIDRIAQLVMWFLLAIRGTNAIIVPYPILIDWIDWVRFTLYTGALNGVLFTVACGAVIISIRAFLGREPGLIEMEVT